MMPERLEVRDSGRVLRIVWAGGSVGELSAGLLRAECRSADARRARIDAAAAPAGDVRITGVSVIGNYAVNIEFSDGERRGLYPWEMLAALERRGGCADDRRQCDAVSA
jgi:DUF971 family protein